MDRKNKIESIYIEDEMLKDPKMDEILKKSIMEEADQVQREMNNDPSLQKIKASDDMFNQIKARLQEQGAWEEDEEEEKQDSGNGETEEAEKIVQEQERTAEIAEEKADTDSKYQETDVYSLLSKEDREALELGKKIKKKRKRKWKQLAAAAAVVLVVFSVGMSGEASRRWMLDIWDKLTLATGIRVATDYVEGEKKNILKYSEEEQLAWEKIKEELGAPVLDFNYLPEGMEFTNYEILIDTNEALLIYSYGDKTFNIRILVGDKEKSNYMQSDVTLKLQEEITNDQDIVIKVWNTSTKGVESYIANFEYQECRFIVNGAFDVEEFEKIMKNLYII